MITEKKVILHPFLKKINHNFRSSLKSDLMGNLSGEFKIKILFHSQMLKFGLHKQSMASLLPMLTLMNFSMKT